MIEAAVAPKVAERLPEGTVTDDGTLSKELLAERDTTVPADGAVDVRVTVHWLIELVSTAVGTQPSDVSVIEAEGCSVMDTSCETPP